MSDNLQQAWQAQSPQARLSIDADLLLNEVRRNQRNFTATIFWRDVREVGAALLMVPIWLVLGIGARLPWSWYLMVPALLWIAGFMLVDRRRHRKRQPEPGESLTQRLTASLADVEHQIWLLRNVFWWYILPPAIPMALFFGHIAWLSLSREWNAGFSLPWLALFALFPVLLVTVVGGVLAGIYWLNQHAIHTDLAPRRAELTALLASLQEEK